MTNEEVLNTIEEADKRAPSLPESMPVLPLRDIVIYERSFDEEYGDGGNILGMVHGQGPILFSARSLKQGFRGEHDGHNVGYHEFAHVLDFDQAGPTEFDLAFLMHGVRYIVDKKSEFFMGGTTLDFNDGLLDRGFVWRNPQASGTCGCGTSFSA